MQVNKKVLSLFSGCGGMDLGFEGNFEVLRKSVNSKIHPDWIIHKHGKWGLLKPTCFNTVFANDIFKPAKVAWTNYFTKRGANEEYFHLGSIVDYVKQEKKGQSIFPKGIDIVTGGFPCQDFSNAGKRNGFNSHRNHRGELSSEYKEPTHENRGNLYTWMKEVIGIVKPKMFVAENVKALTTLGNVKDIIENDFRRIGKGGYIVLSNVLNAVEYGIPQTRERIFFIGILKSALTQRALRALTLDVIPESYNPFPPKTHKLKNKIYTQEERNLLKKYVSTYDAINDLPEPEHAKGDESQSVCSGARYYGRQHQGNVEIVPHSPCYTIRAEHHGNIEFRRLSKKNGGVIENELDLGLKERRLTVRECARIQTFPDNYDFVIKPQSKTDLNRLSSTDGYVVLGNAVPPLLSYHISSRIQSIWSLLFKKG